MQHFVYSWRFILGIGELLGILGDCELRGRGDGWWRRIFWALSSCYYVCYLRSQALGVERFSPQSYTPAKPPDCPHPLHFAPFFFSLRRYIYRIISVSRPGPGGVLKKKGVGWVLVLGICLKLGKTKEAFPGQ